MTDGPRYHHFWDCVIARGLRETIQMTIEDVMGDRCDDVRRSELWLVIPLEILHGKVWDVVCLAAIAALERGRQRLYAARMDDGHAQPGAIRKTCAAVVIDFWARIRSFADLGIRVRGCDTPLSRIK